FAVGSVGVVGDQIAASALDDLVEQVGLDIRLERADGDALDVAAGEQLLHDAFLGFGGGLVRHADDDVDINLGVGGGVLGALLSDLPEGGDLIGDEGEGRLAAIVFFAATGYGESKRGKGNRAKE